ncbi:hypothetical protein DIURU_005498 [Diutina rugosa]|uniref:C2H2-type domain-containing protein n=1 Tax=Diutina rugosa TaxID=5481 RepID=A0A642UD43_DIURU|nr:uncharacterized protein DIURU_005498 [Diutina rugosa]KAA8896985.1 hypothetical protein DIURU_005498 [Diutina rugosa]
MLNTVQPHTNVQLPSIHSLLEFPTSAASAPAPAPYPMMAPPLAPPVGYAHPVQLSAYNFAPTPQSVSVSPRPSPPQLRSESVPHLGQQLPAPGAASAMPPVVVHHHQSSDVSDDDGAVSSADASPSSAKKQWKPRKKRQCPECKLFFSNLATHKSTHLKPASRPHVCKYCQRGFARPNDLFRHIKCHWKEIGSDKGQFKCPFKRAANEDGEDHCCHNTGIFSRCDTFKNHLKAIHFQYPNGTKKDQRTKVPGKCRMCGAHFANVDDWMVNHIEANSCCYAKVKQES